MRKIYRAFKVYQSRYKGTSMAGINFLRDAGYFFNSRHESANCDKGPIRLLMDFSEYVLIHKEDPQPEPIKPGKKFCPNDTAHNLPPIK